MKVRICFMRLSQARGSSDVQGCSSLRSAQLVAFIESQNHSTVAEWLGGVSQGQIT